LQPATIVLLEEIAQHATASLFIGCNSDKSRPLVGGADRGFGQQASDVVGFLLPAIPDRFPDLLLTGMVRTDAEGHELFQRHAVLGIDVEQCR